MESDKAGYETVLDIVNTSEDTAVRPGFYFKRRLNSPITEARSIVLQTGVESSRMAPPYHGQDAQELC